MSIVARCFRAEINKTGRYTNVICCLKCRTCIQSKTPSQMQRQILSGVNAVVRSFFLSCFSFPRFVAWPLEFGLGTHNAQFVGCMVVESCNPSLGRRQKRETKSELG